MVVYWLLGLLFGEKTKGSGRNLHQCPFKAIGKGEGESEGEGEGEGDEG